MLKVKNIKLLSAGDMSGNLASTPLELADYFGYALQMTWTGSPVGTLTLQGSNDAPQPMDANFEFATFAPTNWTTIANSSQAISGPDAVLYNVQGAYYRYVRVVYTFTSGSGSLTVVGNTKGF